MGLRDFIVQGGLAALLSIGGGQTSSLNLRPIEDLFHRGSNRDALFAESQESRQRHIADHFEFRIGWPTDDDGAVLYAVPHIQAFQTGGSVQLLPVVAKRQLDSGPSTSPSPLPMRSGKMLTKEISWVEIEERSDETLPRLQAIDWIQDATGLSDERTASLLGVSRRALLDWKAGKAIKASNLRRLVETMDVLQRAQSRYQSREQLLSWLYSPDQLEGVSPEALLDRGDFDRARFLAVVGPTTVEASAYPIRRAISPEWQAAIQRPPRLGEFDDLE
jgi:hypothetical protein